MWNTFRLFVLAEIFRYAIVTCGRKDLIWDKRQSEFIDLFSIPEYLSLQALNFNETEHPEAGNFNGEILKVAGYEEKNMVMFYENNTKITGIFGDIWNLLADQLNFTLVPVRHENHIFGVRLSNGSYTGVVGLLQRNEAQAIARTGMYGFRIQEMDYTIPIYGNKYRVYIRPIYKYDEKWIIGLFSRDTWYAILTAFFTLSITGYLLQKVIRQRNEAKKHQENLTLIDHLFYTYGLMCAQGHIPAIFYERLKVLSVSKSLFAWMILLALSSQLIYHMTNRRMIPPFTDIRDMFDKTKYHLIAFKGSMVYESLLEAATKRNRLARITFFNNADNMYRNICLSNGAREAIFDTDDRFLASDKFLCELVPIGPGYFRTWIALGLQKGFWAKKLFDISLIKLHEVGLMDALRDRWYSSQFEIKHTSTFKRIDFAHVYILILILFAGFGLSIFILLIENIVFIRENRRE